MASENDSNEDPIRDAMGQLFGHREAVNLEIPEVEFDRDDPLHCGAIRLHGDCKDQLSKAMLLLSEANDLLTAIIEGDDSRPADKDIRRRVRKALKALDKQEQLDLAIFLAFAETQRGKGE